MPRPQLVARSPRGEELLWCDICAGPAVAECEYVAFAKDAVVTSHCGEAGGVVVCNAILCERHAHEAEPTEGAPSPRTLCPAHAPLPDVPGNPPERAA